ncbi:MAG: hypothetical protein Q9192_000611 [Flavoplaca navasiana]
MASHSLAIAKASLAAGLMRLEPGGVSKTDLAQFYRLLEALLSQCSATNIQLCKEWLVKNTALSIDKTKAVGKYLVALSASLSSTDGTNVTGQAKQRKTSSRRRQLYLLFLLHDFIHHVKFHGAQLANDAGVIKTLEPYVTQLVEIAATYDPSKYSRHLSSLNDLINLWGESNYFPSSVVAMLRDTVANATYRSASVARNAELSETTIDTAGNGAGGNQKDAPYIMPASHGDTSVPFYDLPAGNLMPCIIPNSMTPISPQMVKPLQFRAGPADEDLAFAVKAFLSDIDVLYGSKIPGQGYDEMEIDELGQPTALEDTPEDIPISEAYYGWSKRFCEKMKLRSDGEQLARSPPCLGISQLSQRRRRRSSSISGGSLSKSNTESRSSSRGKEAGHRQRRGIDSRSRSHSRPQNNRTSEIRHRTPPAEASTSRSRSRSYSPPDVAASEQRTSHAEANATSGLAREPFPQVATLPPMFLQQNVPSPGQLPVPPPRPPNYSGPWPPPPPPPPPPLSAPIFESQKPGQMPSLATSPQPPKQMSTSGCAQTIYGMASGDRPSPGHRGDTSCSPGRRGQAPPAVGARGHASP